MTLHIDKEVAAMERMTVDELRRKYAKTRQTDDGEAASALADFDGVWESLKPREQVRVLELLVESVVWDVADESLSISLRPTATGEKEHAA